MSLEVFTNDSLLFKHDSYCRVNATNQWTVAAKARHSGQPSRIIVTPSWGSPLLDTTLYAAYLGEIDRDPAYVNVQFQRKFIDILPFVMQAREEGVPEQNRTPIFQAFKRIIIPEGPRLTLDNKLNIGQAAIAIYQNNNW